MGCSNENGTRGDWGGIGDCRYSRLWVLGGGQVVGRIALVAGLLVISSTPAQAHIPVPKSECLDWEFDTYSGVGKIIHANGAVLYVSLPVVAYCVYPVIQYKKFEVDL